MMTLMLYGFGSVLLALVLLAGYLMDELHGTLQYRRCLQESLHARRCLAQPSSCTQQLGEFFEAVEDEHPQLLTAQILWQKKVEEVCGSYK